MRFRVSECVGACHRALHASNAEWFSGITRLLVSFLHARMWTPGIKVLSPHVLHFDTAHDVLAARIAAQSTCSRTSLGRLEEPLLLLRRQHSAAGLAARLGDPTFRVAVPRTPPLQS